MGRARARFALLRGLPRLARFLKTVEITTAPSDLRREGLRLLEELCQGDEEREMDILEKAAVFVPRSYFGKDPYKGLHVDGEQLIADKKKLLSESSIDIDFESLDSSGRRKSNVSSEPQAQGQVTQAAHSALAVVAAQHASESLGVMEQLKADLTTQRVELQVVKENVAFQSRRMADITSSLADLREATSMVLAAQVKILEAVTWGSSSASSSGSDQPAPRQRAPSRDPPSRSASRDNQGRVSVSLPRPRTSCSLDNGASQRSSRTPRLSVNVNSSMGSVL